VATRNATLQFPEITLGILPGIGGCVVPYRRWPHAARLFNEMICFARPLKAAEAAEHGIVTQLADDFDDLMAKAVQEVHALQGNIRRPAEGKLELPPIHLPDEPRAGSQLLSREALAITIQTITAAAGKAKLADALEIGYRGFGAIACTEAAREGISAFLEGRKPVFKK
jgi:enoyl-CoA hydratase/3-hydroxyacyl-CoA dehydrogenase